MFFPRFTLSVSFPSFGINNARWRLCCSSFPAGFSRDATAGDSAGDIEKLTSAGPSSLSESLLALSRIRVWLLFAVSPRWGTQLIGKFLLFYMSLIFTWIALSSFQSTETLIFA